MKTPSDDGLPAGHLEQPRAQRRRPPRRSWRRAGYPLPRPAPRARPRSPARSILLVTRADRQPRRHALEDPRLLVLRRVRGIRDEHRRARLRDGLPGARDADALDLVARLAQPRGVDEVDGHAFEEDRRADVVARRARRTGVTIATSSPASRLSRLDLPTLGGPTSTTVRPSRSTAPCARLVEEAREVGADGRERVALRARDRRDRFPPRESRCTPRRAGEGA